MKIIIEERHLKFLEFILPILRDLYSSGKSLSYLANRYKKEFKIEFNPSELKYFQDLYKDKYFIVEGNLDYVIITPETKKIIDTYGSLSQYIEYNTPHNTPKSMLTKIWVSIKKSIITIILTIIGGFLLYLLIEYYIRYTAI